MSYLLLLAWLAGSIAPAQALPTIPDTIHPSTTRSTTRAWVNPQPDVPFLPKPATRPADWLVEHPPVTPDASPETLALLHYMYSISNHHTLTGQHNYAAQHDESTLEIAREARKTPVIYGIDWGFAAAGDKDSAFVRPQLVDEVTQQWRKGSIITITWHAVRPTEDEPVTFMGSVRGKLTDAQFEELLTPGSALNHRWATQVDAIAIYMKQLQAAHVPLLFRPYHEMNGNWFWWGGRRGQRGSKQLYRMIFDRLVHYHGLNNLIWVWNVDQPVLPDRQFVDYFPGGDVCDVLSLDDYAIFQQGFYDELNALSDGKVLAIGETGVPPAPGVYRNQPKWAWYMLWAGSARWRNRGNGPPIAEIVSDPRLFSLQDQLYWDSINPVRTKACLPTGTPPPPPTTEPR